MLSPSQTWLRLREPSSLRRLFAVASIVVWQSAYASVTQAAESAQSVVNAGIKNASDGTPLEGVTKDFLGIIGMLVQVALQLMGVVFLILMIYAGMRYMLARGEQGEVKKSIDTIQMAVIGLAIVMAAYAFTTFVFERLTGAIAQ